MKQYLKNIVNDLKQFSNTLDKKSLFLNKPWALIDSDLEIQKIIFKSDKDLVLSKDGNAIIGKWEYLSEARSILLDRVTDKILCKDVYLDENILILRKDGSSHGYIILVNENNLSSLDAYEYLTELCFQKSGKMYIELIDKKFMYAERNYNDEIGIGSKVTFDGSVITDGDYLAEGGMKLYVIRDGKINNIINYSSIKSENGERFLTDSQSEYRLRIGDKIFNPDKSSVNDGILMLVRNKLKMKAEIRDGKVVKLQFVQEYNLSSDVKCRIFCKNPDSIEKGDNVIINGKPGLTDKLIIDDCRIKVIDGVVKRVSDSYSRRADYVLIILAIFLIVLFVLLFCFSFLF